MDNKIKTTMPFINVKNNNNKMKLVRRKSLTNPCVRVMG